MRFQLRKHTRIASEKKAQLDEARNSQQVIDLKQEEIPFGIRALEAGVEVEGVVVSRPATPRASLQNFSNLTLHTDARESIASLPSRSSYGAPSPTPGQSLTMDHNARASSVGQQLRSVHQPNAAYLGPQGYHNSNTGPSTPTSQNASPMGTRRSSTDNLYSQHNQASINPTLAKLEGKPPQTYSPGQRKFMSSPDGIRVAQMTPSRSPSPPEGSYSSVEDNQVLDERRMANHLRSHSDEDRLRADRHGDLSLLHSHRLSHAAEVGQLGRRPANSTRQFTASQPSLLSYSTTTPGATTPVGQLTSSNVNVMDIATADQAVAPSGYFVRKLSDEAPRDVVFNPHQIAQSSVAYFEDPVAQNKSSAGPSTPPELAEVDIEAQTPEKRSKKLMKKRSSA